jgi:hypothetical protein
MGFFGSSRKKIRDPLQAVIEQQQRRNPAARFTERQSEPARQHNEDYIRERRPFEWNDSANGHPYEQPGFGFYSGENLAAGRARQQERKKPMSADGGFKNAQHGYVSNPLEEDVFLFSPRPSYPGPSLWEEGGCDAASPESLHCDPWAGTRPWDWPPEGPAQRYLRPPSLNFNDYRPSTMMNPPGRAISVTTRQTPRQSTQFNIPPYNNPRPVFDSYRTFSHTPGPTPYTAPLFNTSVPSDRIPIWSDSRTHIGSPYLGSRMSNGPPRPHGSYERLRPPHLQRGGSRAGGGRGTHSSSSRIGEIR